MEPEQSDSELMLAARSGSRDAFALLLTRHRPLLMSLCHRALRDSGLAEDAAQEASLQALLCLDRLRQPERFGPWLAGIGLNVCHRWQRQRARTVYSWEAVQGGLRVDEPRTEADDPASLAEAAELRSWVRCAVDSLPPGQRAAVMLHYLDGLTQAETALVLGIEVGAVKTRLYKGRANLRRQFASEIPSSVSEARGSVMVEMRIADVRRRRGEAGAAPRHIVILQEISGPRFLTIWIGEAEGVALALELEKAERTRPLTYAFAASVLQAAGGHLIEVRVDRLDGDVFIATTVVEGRSGTREVDARPSDALNLALLLSAPIRVDAAVLEAAGGVRAGEEWSEMAELTDGPRVIVEEVLAEWERSCAPSASAPTTASDQA